MYAVSNCNLAHFINPGLYFFDIASLANMENVKYNCGCREISPLFPKIH
jgi:hypothetical protein